MNNFKVIVHCVVLSADMKYNKQYVLSLSNESIVFPNFEINDEILLDINQYLIKFLKNHIFLSDMELLPQIITLHSSHIKNDNNTINVVYGFLTSKSINLNNVHWYEFNYHEPNEFSNLLFEVTQKLK